MLELDIILINFLEQEYLNLDDKFLSLFDKLLNESDENLYIWLVKGIYCESDYFYDIIDKINKTTQHLKFNH